MAVKSVMLLFFVIILCGQVISEDDNREEKVMKRPIVQGSNGSGNRGEVSETDLYLLGAIEKMAYRLDFIEKRLRRTEDLLHYVMVGQSTTHNQPGEKADPCPANFTRAAGGCYYFSSEAMNIRRGGGGALANWKAATTACKNLGGSLVEFETVEETQDIVSHLKSRSQLRDKSYWTGGLNPGLLWIWADSGRPVSASGGHKKPGNSNNNNKHDIRGSGRCLLLSYDAALRGYNLQGADCGMPQHYLCEAEDNTTGRALERIQRGLKLGLSPANATAIAEKSAENK